MTQPEASLNAPARETRKDERWQVTGLCLALAVMTFAVFGQTVRHEFVNFDDNGYVYENPVVAQGLTLKGLSWAWSFHCDNWHPLTWLSHEVDCQLYGLHPGGHHLSNVLIHTLAVIALFLAMRRMTGALWRSAFVAALFAIHPLRVESVAWIAERKDVLSGLWFMLTIGAYGRYVQEFKAQGSKFKVFYAMALVFFVLGLMSKPMLVTLPAVLLLLDYWPLQRADSKVRLVLEKLPFMALSAAVCVVTLFAQKGAEQSIQEFSLPLRFANALVSYAVYLRQWVWPTGLAVFYPYPHSGLPPWEVALAGTLLAGISVAAWWLRRAQPWVLVGWLWYLVMLLPVSGLIQAGEQAHADRFTYLPQVGIAAAVTWLAAACGAKWRLGRVLLGLLMASALATLIVCAAEQTVHWKNNEFLWRRAASCTTGNYVACNNLGVEIDHGSTVDEAIKDFRMALQIDPKYAEAHYNLGNALLHQGKVDEAISHYQRALEISPSYADAHNNFGNVLAQKGKLEEAAAQYQIALRIRPEYVQAYLGLGAILLQKGKLDEATSQFEKALQINPGYAEGHFNLGTALLQKGKVDDAIAQFEATLKIQPDNEKARLNLGAVFLQQGRLDEAIFQFQLALRSNPGHVGEHLNLAAALQQKGKMDEAIVQLQKALELEPDNPQTLNTLAFLLATCPQATLRNGGQAVQLAWRADNLSGGKNPAILRTLAAALAENGQFAEAKNSIKKAIELAQAMGRPDWTAQLNNELKRYELGLPLHE